MLMNAHRTVAEVFFNSSGLQAQKSTLAEGILFKASGLMLWFRVKKTAGSLKFGGLFV